MRRKIPESDLSAAGSIRTGRRIVRETWRRLPDPRAGLAWRVEGALLAGATDRARRGCFRTPSKLELGRNEDFSTKDGHPAEGDANATINSSEWRHLLGSSLCPRRCDLRGRDPRRQDGRSKVSSTF
ncbi:hypothetical protein THAOC_10278 [Thalassiosira oceanica]|uniref:Uncharacterized protein n=1 Tax=Thalassiosira oceanica TaxID=159749 RepID=K0TDC9_THAOC|nr:hypothetical protein THAOC_10278 [Thalassiosira oceanica]|eukprot:EJK68532.1 hypothetical protein THAOC_10278 [Thalassiosira oceanica]